MKTIAIFYGSDTGSTEHAALLIAESLKEQQVVLFDMAEVSPELMQDYDCLILGLPTWDYGGIQVDWDESWEVLNQQSFEGKTVALFGLGDQFGYPEYFQDALGLLHDIVKDNGGKIIGYWPNDGYEFEASKALTADRSSFVGLALDEDNQSESTEQRIKLWVQKVLQEF